MGAENAGGGSCLRSRSWRVNNHRANIFPVVNIYSYYQITSEIKVQKTGSVGNSKGLSTRDTKSKTGHRPDQQAREPLKSFLCWLFPLPPQLLQKPLLILCLPLFSSTPHSKPNIIFLKNSSSTRLSRTDTIIHYLLKTNEQWLAQYSSFKFLFHPSFPWLSSPCKGLSCKITSEIT